MSASRVFRFTTLVVFIAAFLVAPTLAKERALTNIERRNVQVAIDFLRQNGMDPKVPVTIKDIQDRLDKGRIKIDKITKPAGVEALTKINGIIVLNQNDPIIGAALRDSPSVYNTAALAAVLVHETLHSKFHSIPEGAAAQLTMMLFRFMANVWWKFGIMEQVAECAAYYAQLLTERRWVENKLNTGRDKKSNYNQKIKDFRAYIPKLPGQSSKLTQEQRRRIVEMVSVLRELKNQITGIADDTAVLADLLSHEISAFEEKNYESERHRFHDVMKWAKGVSKAMEDLQNSLVLQEMLFRQWLDWANGKIQQRPQEPNPILPIIGLRPPDILKRFRAKVFKYNDKVQDFQDYVAKLPEKSSKLTQGQRESLRIKMENLERIIIELSREVGLIWEDREDPDYVSFSVVRETRTLA